MRRLLLRLLWYFVATFSSHIIVAIIIAIVKNVMTNVEDIVAAAVCVEAVDTGVGHYICDSSSIALQ